MKSGWCCSQAIEKSFYGRWKEEIGVRCNTSPTAIFCLFTIIIMLYWHICTMMSAADSILDVITGFGFYERGGRHECGIMRKPGDRQTGIGPIWKRSLIKVFSKGGFATLATLLPGYAPGRDPSILRRSGAAKDPISDGFFCLDFILPVPSCQVVISSSECFCL